VSSSSDQHAGLERALVALGDVGRLVSGDPEAVPGPVQDAVPVASVGDDLANGRVDLAQNRARPGQLVGAGARLEHGLERCLGLLGNLSQEEGALELDAVAVDLGERDRDVRPALLHLGAEPRHEVRVVREGGRPDGPDRA
jgi:hypothetical protein